MTASDYYPFFSKSSRQSYLTKVKDFFSLRVNPHEVVFDLIMAFCLIHVSLFDFALSYRSETFNIIVCLTSLLIIVFHIIRFTSVATKALVAVVELFSRLVKIDLRLSVNENNMVQSESPLVKFIGWTVVIILFSVSFLIPLYAQNTGLVKNEFSIMWLYTSTIVIFAISFGAMVSGSDNPRERFLFILGIAALVIGSLLFIYLCLLVGQKVGSVVGSGWGIFAGIFTLIGLPIAVTLLAMGAGKVIVRLNMRNVIQRIKTSRYGPMILRSLSHAVIALAMSFYTMLVERGSGTPQESGMSFPVLFFSGILLLRFMIIVTPPIRFINIIVSAAAFATILTGLL